MFAWIFIAGLVVTFGGVVLFGAPYLPIRRLQQEQALKLLGLKPGQVLYDLGCGDGRLLRTAAKHGITAKGYELNPILFIFCWLASLRYGRRVQVRFGNFWKTDISDTDGVFVFLLDKYMRRLDKFMNQQNFSHPVKLVSYAFKIPGKKTARKSTAFYLYEY